MPRRLARFAFAFAAAVSLLLCIAAVVVAFWAGAQRKGVHVITARDGWHWDLYHGGDRIALMGLSGWPRDEPLQVVPLDKSIAYAHAAPAEYWDLLFVNGLSGQAQYAGPLGGVWASRGHTRPGRFHVVRTSAWTPPVLAAVLPGLWFGMRLGGAWRRSRRRRAGLCPQCGYDLRATPGRCPECGRSESVGVGGQA